MAPGGSTRHAVPLAGERSLRFAGAWILLVAGRRSTSSAPFLPAVRDGVSNTMTVWVADCVSAYQTLSARGGQFLTPPNDWNGARRCFLRDPDGHLIQLSEVG